MSFIRKEHVFITAHALAYNKQLSLFVLHSAHCFYFCKRLIFYFSAVNITQQKFPRRGILSNTVSSTHIFESTKIREKTKLKKINEFIINDLIEWALSCDSKALLVSVIVFHCRLRQLQTRSMSLWELYRHDWKLFMWLWKRL